jgi:hypothetical protein
LLLGYLNPLGRIVAKSFEIACQHASDELRDGHLSTAQDAIQVPDQFPPTLDAHLVASETIDSVELSLTA